MNYAAPVSELEPRRRRKKEVAPRHIPQEVVPIPFDEVRDFVRDPLKGTSLVDPIASVFAGYVFFEPHLHFTPVDDTHTRIEIDGRPVARVNRLPRILALTKLKGFSGTATDPDGHAVVKVQSAPRNHRTGTANSFYNFLG